VQTLVSTGDIRVLLLKCIDQTPGIRYRELLRMTGLVNGVLTYHLAVLEKSSVIRVDRGSRITRYYPLSVSDKESAILKVVRHEPVRKVVLFILEHRMCTFNEIVDHVERSPSTVSLHLKRLREAGFVSIRLGEKNQLYYLVQEDLVAEVISKYKESFVDRVVDNYTEMLEEL
jgi:predicted transcriptional regulator